MFNNINSNSTIAFIFSKKFRYYEFPKMKKYYKEAVSIYEIPQYIEGVPLGFSFFSTLPEIIRIKDYLFTKKEEYEKSPKTNSLLELKIFEEPIPKHNYCHIGKNKFKILKSILTIIHIYIS